jgi:hypothetical protein
MYSKEGERETFVPPLMVMWIGQVVFVSLPLGIEKGRPEKRTNGRMAWKTSPILPGLPISI